MLMAKTNCFISDIYTELRNKVYMKYISSKCLNYIYIISRELYQSNIDLVWLKK